MTDERHEPLTPDPRVRPTDETLREFTQPSVWELTPMRLVGAEICKELLAARALLADLKAEGCPERFDESGDPWCAWCGVLYPRRDDTEHRPMEDGQPCLWMRISQA